eukprot:11176542-Alexandrium_andersonii.AAC.1
MPGPPWIWSAMSPSSCAPSPKARRRRPSSTSWPRGLAAPPSSGSTAQRGQPRRGGTTAQTGA